MSAQDGKLQPATWDEAFAAIAAKLAGIDGRADRRHRRRPVRCRIDGRAEGPDGGASARPTSTAARTAPSSMPACRARLPLQHRRSPASSRPTPPADRHQSALGSAGRSTPASASATCTAAARSASIGPAVDLTYPYEHLGAGPTTLRELADGRHALRREAEGGQEADADPRHGRAGARRTARRCWRWPASSPSKLGMVRGRLERLQRAAHRGGARRRPRSRLRAGRGRPRRRGHPGRLREGRDRRRLSAGRRRDRHRRGSARPS